MTRITDYWNLAQCTNEKFQKQLDHIVDKHARNTAEREEILMEALRMVERYVKLFSDNA
jgi:hypothetical protein